MRISDWSSDVCSSDLLDWLQIANIDVLALQEIKTIDDGFPRAELEAAGYRAVSNGQKTYNGVALLAREEISEVVRDMDGFADEQKRVIAATINGLRLIRVYEIGQASGRERVWQYG